MEITGIKLNKLNSNQPSFKTQEGHKSYLESNEKIYTDNNVKPLPPEGYLIHDNIGNSIKYFFKDIGYDIKAMKNGWNGKANDHQAGRFNDIGLALGGILIATYLASRTTNPRARLMEYIGLGTFLTVMAIYPKLAINGPAKLKHGFDIDKQYIDDQGRKKSVMQDSNYIPYDMYLGEIPQENLSVIGDRMGIPKDIKNRNDVIKEQMRKISIQNNTLWMLTAGFATPTLTALLCCGLENFVVGPAAEKVLNEKSAKAIKNALAKTQQMTDNIESLKNNSLSNRIEHILSRYKGQELPKEEFDNIAKIFSENMFANTTEGIKNDLQKLFKNSAAEGSESVLISKDSISEIIQASKKAINGRNRSTIEEVLVPTEEELINIIKKYTNEQKLEKETNIKLEDANKIKEEIKNLLDTKISNTSGIPKDYLKTERNNIIENIHGTILSKKSSFVSEKTYKQVIDFAKVMGDFKENQHLLDTCKSYKVEFAPETIIARSYSKFENALLDGLKISFKDLKKMEESKEYTKKILDEKLIELAKDQERFGKTIKKLGQIISDMEVKLHGPLEDKSQILDLVNAIENNYNKTAKRLSQIGGFENTIDKLIKQDVTSLTDVNKITTKQELFDLLDGIKENVTNEFFRADGEAKAKEWWQINEEKQIQYLKEHADGVGSSKSLEISRLIERYQGAKNSFNRILLTMDVYNRAQTPEEFAAILKGRKESEIATIIKESKEALLKASASDHTQKLNMVNNFQLYKDIMNSTYITEALNEYSTKQKGIVTETTAKALSESNSMAKGNVLDRFLYYISRAKNLFGNSSIDFTKLEHLLDTRAREAYTTADKTRMAFFNLVGQTPVDMLQGAAKRRFSTQKWAQIIGTITGLTFLTAFLAQLGFGKLSNPQNLQKAGK